LNAHGASVRGGNDGWRDGFHNGSQFLLGDSVKVAYLPVAVTDMALQHVPCECLSWLFVSCRSVQQAFVLFSYLIVSDLFGFTFGPQGGVHPAAFPQVLLMECDSVGAGVWACRLLRVIFAPGLPFPSSDGMPL